MSNGLYDALRSVGLDLLRAHRLDVYLRTVGDDRTSEQFARSLHGDPVDLSPLRATLLADLDAIMTGLALLEGGPGVTVSRPVSGLLSSPHGDG